MLLTSPTSLPSYMRLTSAFKSKLQAHIDGAQKGKKKSKEGKEGKRFSFNLKQSTPGYMKPTAASTAKIRTKVSNIDLKDLAKSALSKLRVRKKTSTSSLSSRTRAGQRWSTVLGLVLDYVDEAEIIDTLCTSAQVCKAWKTVADGHPWWTHLGQLVRTGTLDPFFIDSLEQPSPAEASPTTPDTPEPPPGKLKNFFAIIRRKKSKPAPPPPAPAKTFTDKDLVAAGWSTTCFGCTRGFRKPIGDLQDMQRRTTEEDVGVTEDDESIFELNRRCRCGTMDAYLCHPCHQELSEHWRLWLVASYIMPEEERAKIDEESWHQQRSWLRLLPPFSHAKGERMREHACKTFAIAAAAGDITSMEKAVQRLTEIDWLGRFVCPEHDMCCRRHWDEDEGYDNGCKGSAACSEEGHYGWLERWAQRRFVEEEAFLSADLVPLDFPSFQTDTIYTHLRLSLQRQVDTYLQSFIETNQLQLFDEGLDGSHGAAFNGESITHLRTLDPSFDRVWVILELVNNSIMSSFIAEHIQMAARQRLETIWGTLVNHHSEVAHLVLLAVAHHWQQQQATINQRRQEHSNISQLATEEDASSEH
ncbi:hypothetical protein HK102_007317, partial [Quaeritorhiza haematococci]